MCVGSRPSARFQADLGLGTPQGDIGAGNPDGRQSHQAADLDGEAGAASNVGEDRVR